MTTGDSLVGVIMGSQSDWDIMKNVGATLDELGIANESRVISAHRTPDLLDEYIANATSRGVKVLICGAGGAAHLAGVTAAKTRLPVLGVPMESKTLGGMDSLLSTVQMPAGIPVATFAIGRAGAINAALFAAAILAQQDSDIDSSLEAFRARQSERVASIGDPSKSDRAKV